MIGFLIFITALLVVTSFAFYHTIDTLHAWLGYLLFKRPVVKFKQYDWGNHETMTGSLFYDKVTGSHYIFRYPAHKIGREEIDIEKTKRIDEWVTAKPMPRELKIKDMIK